ncbi:MAG: metal-dependent transcriptional regulator, partial [Candidatus Zixiibacteriota bacterium]
ARGIDVAKYLNITRGSVSVTMSKLKARGFITEDSNRFYRLTAEGLENVELVLNKRSIIRRFFTDVLGLTEDIATIDACKVEHLLSRRSMGKLLCFTDFYLSDNRDTKKFRNAYNKTCKGVRRI